MRRGKRIALFGAIIAGTIGESGCTARSIAAAGVEAPPIPTASDAAADSLLVELTTVIPGLRTDVRYATADNFTGSVLPGYEAPRAYLRWEAAVALGRVQRALHARGLGLLVYDGYRPVRASAGMVAWAERTGRTALVSGGYVARRSRHNMGVAVDLTLVAGDTGTPLEMGTAYDHFGPAAHTANANGEAARNRAMLVRAMEAEGFRNYAQEWWHFSFDVPSPRPFDRIIRAAGTVD